MIRSIVKQVQTILLLHEIERRRVILRDNNFWAVIVSPGNLSTSHLEM